MKISEIISDNCDLLGDVREAEEKQQHCEDEYIKVPKKALKYRTAGMVAYNAEWLKKHFDLERAVICGVQEHYEDAISRQAAIDAIYARYIGGKEAVDKAPDNDQYAEGIDEAVCAVEDLPPVTPQPKDNIKGSCVEITDNLTNGDVIKTIFPNIDDCFSNVIDLNLWWKSTYKGVKE